MEITSAYLSFLPDKSFHAVFCPTQPIQQSVSFNHISEIAARQRHSAADWHVDRPIIHAHTVVDPLATKLPDLFISEPITLRSTRLELLDHMRPILMHRFDKNTRLERVMIAYSNEIGI